MSAPLPPNPWWDNHAPPPRWKMIADRSVFKRLASMHAMTPDQREALREFLLSPSPNVNSLLVLLDDAVVTSDETVFGDLFLRIAESVADKEDLAARLLLFCAAAFPEYLREAIDGCR